MAPRARTAHAQEGGSLLLEVAATGTATMALAREVEEPGVVFPIGELTSGSGSLSPCVSLAARPARALRWQPRSPALDHFVHVLGPAGAHDVRALARRSASKALTALVIRFAAVPTMHPGPIAAE